MNQQKRDMHAIRTILDHCHRKGLKGISFQQIALQGGEDLYPAFRKMLRSGEIIQNNDGNYMMADGYVLEAVDKNDSRLVSFRAVKGNAVNSYDPFMVKGIRATFEEWADHNGVKDYIISQDIVLFKNDEDVTLAYMRFYVGQSPDD